MFRLFGSLLGLITLSFLGLNACQQSADVPPASESLSDNKASSSPAIAEEKETDAIAAEADPQAPTVVETGCRTLIEQDLGKPIDITSSTFMEDGTFLLLWRIDEADYGSCTVDAEGNVVTVTTSRS